MKMTGEQIEAKHKIIRKPSAHQNSQNVSAVIVTKKTEMQANPISPTARVEDPFESQAEEE